MCTIICTHKKILYLYIRIKNNNIKKIEIMTITKEKVIAKLVANGNNVNEVNKMVELHFEYASKHYATLKTICECIRTIY